VDSIKRVKYLQLIAERESTIDVINPINEGFNPMLAATYHRQNGNLDEAFWLVFLATHFGKDGIFGWGYVRNVYSKLNSGSLWSWTEVCDNVEGFRVWLYENIEIIRPMGKFSNHRKFQSLDAFSDKGTGATVETYVKWIGDEHSHQVFLTKAIDEVGENPRKLFRHLYNSMTSVVGFGRLGKFDYLTNIGKLGLAPIIPDSTYMAGASGPKRGAILLFGQNMSNREFDKRFASLESHLELNFGMQVLEDAVCNWQKDINNYTHFKG